MHSNTINSTKLWRNRRSEAQSLLHKLQIDLRKTRKPINEMIDIKHTGWRNWGNEEKGKVEERGK